VHSVLHSALNDLEFTDIVERFRFVGHPTPTGNPRAAITIILRLVSLAITASNVWACSRGLAACAASPLLDGGDDVCGTQPGRLPIYLPVAFLNCDYTFPVHS
jgi:hypothetical protein